MPKTSDTQLREIYKKFNKLRDTSNILSEQMNPREKRQLESSFRAIQTNIDYIKKEVKIISKLLMRQGMKNSVREIQQSFKRKVLEFGLDIRNVSRQHLGEAFPDSSLGSSTYSNPEAMKHSIHSVNKVSKLIGQAQQKAVTIFTSDMKKGKYDKIDLSRSIFKGNIKDSSFSKRDVLKSLYYDLKDRFTKYGRRKKMIKLTELIKENKRKDLIKVATTLGKRPSDIMKFLKKHKLDADDLLDVIETGGRRYSLAIIAAMRGNRRALKQLDNLLGFL